MLEGANLELRDRKDACVFHPILLAETKHEKTVHKQMWYKDRADIELSSSRNSF